MTEQFETIQDCAAEAEFQLSCAKSYLTWVLALARAIQLVHIHGAPDVGAGLESLAKYLADSGLSATSDAVSQFAQVADPHAPQNHGLENRGAHGEGDL